MNKFLILCISSAIFLSGIFTAYADTPLSEDNIQHFMNAMKPLQELGKKYDFDENDDDEDNEDNENKDEMTMTGASDIFSPMSESLEKVKNHEAFKEFESIILEAGFDDVSQWANVGDRVMRAYMSLKMLENMTPEKIQELKTSIREIEQNEYLSPKIKKQLVASLNQTITIYSQPPLDDKADHNIVKPYLARLDRLFEDLK